MQKRVMVQTGIRDGIREVFDPRPDIDYEIFTENSEENLIKHIPEFDACILGLAPFTEKITAHATRMKVVGRLGVGYDTVDVPALTRAGIPFTVVGTANSLSVAEHTLYFILALAKNGTIYDREGRKGWGIRNLPCYDIANRKILVLGFGRIGGHLVKRLVAMEMEVYIFDPYVKPEVITAAGATPVTDWRALLPEIDYLSVNCPKNEETTGMVSTEEFNAMKSTACVVNTARGGIIEEDALYHALKNKVIRGGAIDAFVIEPTPADTPLFELDNLIVTPHTAGTTQEALYRMDKRAAQNCVDGIDGKLDPEYVINKEVL